MNEVLPEGWERKLLNEFVTKVGSGITPKGGSAVYVDIGIPFIRSQNIYSTGLKLDNVSYITKDQHEKMLNSQLKPNDVLLNITGASIGRCYYLPDNFLEGNVNQHVCIIRVDNKRYNYIFLSYFLNSHLGKTQVMSLQAGGNREGLNFKQIRAIKLLAPPLPEQKKIASILSSIDEVIEKTTAQVAKLKDLKTSLMQELLTKGIGHSEFKDSPVGRIPVEWEVVKTGHVTKSIVPGRNKPKKFDGDIPWLTIADLNSIYVHASTKKLGVSRNILDEAKGKTLPKNTVIMSVVGEFGISSIASCELVINQQLHGFVCNKKIAPTFLCLILRFYKKQIEKLATQTTIAYINKDNAESILFALPPLDEQKKISSSILSIDQKITTTNQKLSALTHTKKALMQDLLTGKKRVTV